MQGASIRTLTLLLVLLLAVISRQYVVTVRATEAKAIWLAGYYPSSERYGPAATGCSVSP